MEGIILGITLNDYRSQLQVSDLVCVDDIYYKLEKIDARYLVADGEPDNENKYIVSSKVNGEPMNFSRSEISKANIGVFDASKWFNENKRIMLGKVSNEDMRNIRAKHLIDFDLSLDLIDSVHNQDLIDLTFNGEVFEKEVVSQYIDELPTLIKYFKVC